MTLKKLTKVTSVFALSLLLVACGNDTDEGEGSSETFDLSQNIHVVTREDGSGTRGAFVEIAGVVDENEDDATIPEATVQNSTNAVMQTVANDTYSIGYISLGSLDDSVTGVPVDGVEPTAENVASGDYTVARNFNVVYGNELSEVAQDFWNFFFSDEAQKIAEDQGYVAVETEGSEYQAAGLSGTINVVGSTSVEPLMAELAEAYQAHNPDVTIDITAPGSGAGITAAIDGSADIGMASRELSEDELADLTEGAAIAVDGIAIIANKENPIENLTLEQIQSIYLGELTTWGDVE